MTGGRGRGGFLRAEAGRSTDSPWRDLGIRAASGTILALVGLGAIWVGGALWAVTIGLLGAVMVVEWFGLCGAEHRWRAAGLLYIAPALAALVWMRSTPDGLHRVLFLAAIVWAGDVGAYFFGRLLGGPRLAPLISPGKTWTGAAGGTLCAVLAGVLAWPGHTGRVALAALLLSLAAQAGDLLESAVKRRFGAKDSGRIIPGHGGMLDRLDGVLTAAPLAALLAVAGLP